MPKAMKQFLQSKLTNNQQSLIRFSYNVLKNPGDLNSHLNRLRYDRGVLRKPTIDFTPPIFNAAITNNCNLRCPTCLFLLEDSDKFSPGYIRPEVFGKILEKYNSQRKIKIIWFGSVEPLLHPEIDQLVDICKQYNCLVKVSTNGLLIKAKVSSLLRIGAINVSIDGYDYQSYQKCRGGNKQQFDLVLEGLKILKEQGCYFGMSYLLTSENVSQVNKMIELSQEIKPSYVYFHNVNPHGCQKLKSLTIRDENTKLFLEKLLQRSDYPFDIIISAIFNPDSPEFLQAKCIQPWFLFCFNWSGDVSYCCHLAHDQNIGNAVSGYDFNSPQMSQFRQGIIKGKIPASCLYCQRRFMGKEFGTFAAKLKKWFIK